MRWAITEIAPRWYLTCWAFLVALALVYGLWFDVLKANRASVSIGLILGLVTFLLWLWTPTLR
jgi:hypothetical protein